MTPDQIGALISLLGYLKDAGIVGALLLFLKMLLSGEIISKREHDAAILLIMDRFNDLEKRYQEVKQLAERGTEFGERAVDLAAAEKRRGQR